jgi:hypothetical protein
MSDLLNSASLVMIPSGYKEDTVFSAIPTDGSGDLSFTRASNGTRVNSAGLVEVVAWNLLEYSEDLTNAYWSKDPGVSIDSNVATAPNGTTTADRANYSGTAISFYRIETFSGANTFSVYLKGEGANIGKQLELEINNSGGTINVTLTGDWVRYETNANNANAVAIKRRTSGQATSVLVWGIQVNQGALKPYFPTTDRLNVPRLTYQNGGGGCPSLLLEKQSTNLLTYSEQFDQSSWTKQNSSVTANSTTSPDGTQNADKLLPNNGIGITIPAGGIFTAGASAYIRSGALTLTAASYTFSIFVKKAEFDYVQLRAGTSVDLINNASGNDVNLNNGTTSIANSVQDYGNGWYRVSLTFTATAATWYVGIWFWNSTSLTANGSQGILAYGAQLELGSYATSYIPTTSASATRVADACFKTGISSLIGQTEGVLFAEIIVNITGVNQNLELGDGTGDNRVTMRLTTSNTFQLVIVQGSSVVFNQSSSATFAQGQKIKIAAAYKSGAVTQLFFNGVSVLSATAGTISGNLTAIYDGNAGGVSDKMNSPISQLVIFKTQLTNAELIALTS